MEKQIIEMQYIWAMNLWSAVIVLMVLFVVGRRVRVYLSNQKKKRKRLLNRRRTALELELKERREELRLTRLGGRYETPDCVYTDIIKLVEQDIEDIEKELQKLS